MVRILIAGLVGGIALFIWGAISHTVLPIGEMGIQEMPNEEPVLAAVKSTITQPGMYYFPGEDKSAPPEKRAEAWSAKWKANPRGLLIVNPLPTEKEMMSPQTLGTEFISNVVAALIAAAIASALVGGMMTRILAIAGMGLLGWVSLIVSYWNWYGFPTEYALGALATEVVGWFLAGLAIAPILGKRVVTGV
jgi:hypothetical protein